MTMTELREIRKAARQRRQTVSAWVRDVLREARRAAPDADPGRKLAAIRRASRHALPTGDIGEILADIERGRRDPGA